MCDIRWANINSMPKTGRVLVAWTSENRDIISAEIDAARLHTIEHGWTHWRYPPMPVEQNG